MYIHIHIYIYIYIAIYLFIYQDSAILGDLARSPAESRGGAAFIYSINAAILHLLYHSYILSLCIYTNNITTIITAIYSINLCDKVYATYIYIYIYIYTYNLQP